MELSRPASQQGWYPDPAGRAEYRWWTGAEWTYRIASGGQLFAEATGDLSAFPPPLASGVPGSNPQAAPRSTRAVVAQPSGAARLSTINDVVEVVLSPGAAFRAGFFAFYGWLAASLITAVVMFFVFVVLAALFGACAAAARHPMVTTH